MNESPRPLHVFARLPWVEVDFAPHPLAGKGHNMVNFARRPSRGNRSRVDPAGRSTSWLPSAVRPHPVDKWVFPATFSPVSSQML